MKLTKKELNILIERYLLESREEGTKYKLWIAIRKFGDLPDLNVLNEIFAPNPVSALYYKFWQSNLEYLDTLSKSGHAWIMIQKPGEPIRSLSGKCGAAKFGTKIGKRLTIGRDESEFEFIERVVLTVKESDEYKKDKEKLKDHLHLLINKTNWGPLLKLVNYEKDTFEVANQSSNFLASFFGGETEDERKLIIEKIESAFENYNEDVIYDPMPNRQDAPDTARNSNSFAYTLLRSHYQDHEIRARAGDKNNINLPGWGMIVPGLRAGSSKKNGV